MGETLGKNATGLHRRTVLKGAAWSVPVVAAAVATPLAAASGCADYALTIRMTGANGNLTQQTLMMSFTKNGVAQSLAGVVFTVSLASGHTFTSNDAPVGGVQLTPSGPQSGRTGFTLTGSGSGNTMSVRLKGVSGGSLVGNGMAGITIASGTQSCHVQAAISS